MITMFFGITFVFQVKNISQLCQFLINDVSLFQFEFPNENITNITAVSIVGGEDSRFTSAASEYFNRAILELHHSQGLHDLGAVKWDIALCLLAVYVICYFSLWKGISTSGKVVWFTALFPYVVLLILFIRGITLPGSAEGIKYYLNPNFEAITKAEVSHLATGSF